MMSSPSPAAMPVELLAVRSDFSVAIALVRYRATETGGGSGGGAWQNAVAEARITHTDTRRTTATSCWRFNNGVPLPGTFTMQGSRAIEKPEWLRENVLCSGEISQARSERRE